MVTLQDISYRLMRPAKDLAKWNFPLAQVLEKYYALLEDPTSINFGEAALVLQNTANVYVHRVECLFDETELLKLGFIGHSEEENKTDKRRKRNVNNSYCNLGNFELINLENSVGKNINLKSPYIARKPIKLLNRRFPQLQNNSVQFCIPSEIFDVYGDIIGKKYDFRCNQDISANGALVDELTPKDFSYSRGTIRKETRNPSSTPSEANTHRTRTSGYYSANEYVAATDIDEASSPGRCFSPGVPENCETNCDEHTEVCVPLLENHEATNEPIVDQKSVETFNKEENQLKTVQVSETVENKEEINKIRKEKGKEFRQKTLADKEFVKDINNSSTEVVDSGILMNNINELDEELWKSMALEQGVENKRCRRRCFPAKTAGQCNNSKINIVSRKRKVSLTEKKPESLVSFVPSKFPCSERNITAPGCLSKSIFKPLEKHELCEYEKDFDDWVNGQENPEVPQYDAVTGNSMELLGFRLRVNEDDDLPENILEESSCAFSQISSDFRHSSPSDNDYYDLTDHQETDLSLPYQTLVEDRMKEILGESDVQTELEQSVSQWHESVYPRLVEAEQRPAFSIRDYTTKIVDTLHSIDKKKMHFDNVVKGKPAYEVARYFLASLQLANTYSVQINTVNNSKSKIEIVLTEDETRTGPMKDS